MTTKAIDTSALLLQLRRMADDAGIPASEKPQAAPAVPFTHLLEQSLQSVNARSGEASEMRQAFETGRPDVELSDVMIAVQKARVSFEALTQVRNKMVSAYKEIMSMPI